MNRCRFVDDKAEDISGILTEKGIQRIDANEETPVGTKRNVEELPDYLRNAPMRRLKLTRITPAKPAPVTDSDCFPIRIPALRSHLSLIELTF